MADESKGREESRVKSQDSTTITTTTTRLKTPKVVRPYSTPFFHTRLAVRNLGKSRRLVAIFCPYSTGAAAVGISSLLVSKVGCHHHVRHVRRFVEGVSFASRGMHIRKRTIARL
jgi:hypothetical protein